MKIGVIGGSGLYELDGLVDRREITVETPFGPTSDALLTGRLGDVELVFLSRHGRGHRYTPTTVPYRANLWAMRKLGVRWALSVSAVGSLREDVAPGEIVLVDQFIDRTVARPSTFFDTGLVGHVGFGDPVAPELHGLLAKSASRLGIRHHGAGTYVCIEGPAFSTRAESNLYRSWGATVVGMTNLPEAKLAREAGIAYATIALVTDWDCWREEIEAVSADHVAKVVAQNVATARRLIVDVAPEIAAFTGRVAAHHSLEGAVMTADAARDPAVVHRLAPLLGIDG
jgi:5'-methylthioadenosine phosphorylase